MAFPNGANDFTFADLERYLEGDGDATPASSADGAQQSGTTEPAADKEPEANKGSDVTQTQAFANRLKEATTKARNEERDSIAKELGYESYADMQKKREIEMLEAKGFDPKEVSPIVDELVNKRIAEDPRFKELDTIREQRAKEWAEKELNELSALTGGRIKTLADVPKTVIDRWKQTGSLKGAYMELEGENLIRSMRATANGEATRGTTTHLASPTGTPTATRNETRPMTDHEKDIYRLFNPGVTDEELSKMTKPV